MELRIEMQNTNNNRTFSARLTLQDLKQNTQLSPYFDHPKDVHHHLQQFKQQIKITPDEDLSFFFQVSGKSQPVSIVIRMKRNQFKIEEVMLLKMCKLQKLMLKKYKEEEQQKVQSLLEKQKPGFVLDFQYIEFENFKKFKNQIEKIKESDVFSAFYGQEIKPNTKFRYKVLQVDVISNIKYGFSKKQKNPQKPHQMMATFPLWPYSQQSKHLVVFNTATRMYKPSNKESISGTIVNGQTIEVEVDLINFKFTCYRNGQSLGTVPIHEEMKYQPIFPVIFMYSVGDKIELLI